MDKNKLLFDDFDLDLHTDDESIEPAGLGFITQGVPTSFDNSSTSWCCAMATNVTEDGCSWCATC